MSAPDIIPALATDGLRAGYGRGGDIVAGIDLTLPPETILAVIGPNGSGKSTFIKTLAGVVPARAGRITLEGQDVTALTASQRTGAGLAYVPQERNIFPSMTIRENLLLATEFLRSRPGVGQLYEERVLELFPDIARRPRLLAGNLSGGQRQMLAFACALLANPSVLLLDEPSAGLSPLVVGEIMEVVQRVRKTGVTVVLVEQNVSAALRIADDVAVLVAGCLSLRARVADLATHGGLRELYLGGENQHV